MIDLNTLAGLLAAAMVLAGLAGIVACIVLLIRLIPSPVPGACQCCGAQIPADGAAYCGLCWGLLVAAKDQGRAVPSGKQTARRYWPAKRPSKCAPPCW